MTVGVICVVTNTVCLLVICLCVWLTSFYPEMWGVPTELYNFVLVWLFIWLWHELFPVLWLYFLYKLQHVAYIVASYIKCVFQEWDNWYLGGTDDTGLTDMHKYVFSTTSAVIAGLNTEPATLRQAGSSNSLLASARECAN